MSCLDCNDRYVGCHSNYYDYQQFRRVMDAAKERRAEVSLYKGYVIDATERMKTTRGYKHD